MRTEVRKASLLAHFDERAIRDPGVLDLVEKVDVIADPAMDIRGHSSADLRVWMKGGRHLERQADAGPGFPERPLVPEDHLRRFHECNDYARRPLPPERAGAIIDAIDRLETMPDVRELISLFAG